MVNGVEWGAERGLDRPPLLQQQPVEAMVERDEADHGASGCAGPSGADSHEQSDGAGGAQTMSPAKVQVQRCLPVAEQKADPGHTADGEVGANHLYEGPLLQVLSLDARLKQDRRASGDKAHTEFDVLNGWPRESPFVESPNVEKRIPPYGAEPSPERFCGACSFLVDVMVKKIAERRNVALCIGLVVIGAENSSQARVGAKGISEPLEDVGMHLDVGVNEDEHVSCRLRCPPIPGVGRARRRWPIDHDQLVGSSVRSMDCVQTPVQGRGTVRRRHDDRKPRSCGRSVIVLVQHLYP